MTSAKPAAPRLLPPDEKRQLIFAAAREVIAARGFDAAKMDEIAARAGVGKGTLYNFFASKEELFLSLVMEESERIGASIDAEVERARDPWDQIEIGWTALLLRVFPELTEQWNFNYQLWGILARDAGARARLFAQWRELYRAREQRTIEAIAAGQASGQFRADVDATLLAPLLLAIFDGLLHRSLFDPERSDPHRALRAILDLMRRVLDPATPR